MAYNLCSSPSSLFLDRQPLYNPLSFSHRLKPRNLNCPIKLSSLSSQSRCSLQISQVSVQEPIPQETQNPDASTKPNSEFVDGKASSASKSYIWVNPRSRRATQLRKTSYDARYNFLVGVAESLNTCDSVEENVFGVLRGLGDDLIEQEAVVILNNMENSGNALLALRFFDQNLKIHKKRILYNVTLKVCRKCKDLGRAEKLFDEMLERGVKPDNVTFATIISCSMLCLMPQKAVEWFEKMPTFECQPDSYTYSIMIDAYGKAGHVEMALSLYDRARTENWRIDVMTFSTLIKMYSKSGNFDGCLNVYEEMKALGVKPNMGIYNTLLDAMGRAKRPWQVKHMFKEMTDNGYSPNWATYAALVRAFCRARYGEDAVTMYREMKQKGLELNVLLYNSLLAMCADMGFDDQAYEIFQDMKSSQTCKPDTWTFSSMITICCCSGEVSKAEAMLNEMLEAGFEPTIHILTSLIQCYGKAKRTNDVVKTFDSLLELGITPDDRFCCCLLNVMTQTPREELAKLIACLEKANSKLGHIVKLLLEEQDGEEKFKEEASALLESSSADVKRPFCNCLMDICVNLNLFERANELLNIGLTLGIYRGLQLRSPAQWSLYVKGLSHGAALTALYAWLIDLSKTLESEEELPPLLGINTGHGKHRYTEHGQGLIGAFKSHLKELDAPFHESEEKSGWFLTTNVAARSWLESRRSSPDLVAA